VIPSTDDEALFPLSAICHYAFCPRRCALVHTERLWSDNYFTASGETLHETVDRGGSESRRERRLARSLHLKSAALGIYGIADVVEFYRDDAAGAAIRGWSGRWLPCPVEYKWGTAKNERPYMHQLCAQAICLEEMLGVRLSEGVLFLGAARHRKSVSLDETLRAETRDICAAIHRLLDSGEIPPPNCGPHCKSCSMADDCLPSASRRSARAWLDRAIGEALQ
jgi:CRISPR-associated exonuclease Cas4